jgi:agmatinase
MLSTTLTVALLAASVIAHGDHADQMPIAGPHKSLWYNTLPGDGGTQVCQLDGIYPITTCGC